MDTQARRPSLASVVGTRERERREIPHDVSSDPARQRLHFDPAKPCLGRECPGSRRRRLEADVGDVPGRVPVRRCDRESRIPGSSRIIPAYPGLKLLIDLTVRAPGVPKDSLVLFPRDEVRTTGSGQCRERFGGATEVLPPGSRMNFLTTRGHEATERPRLGGEEVRRGEHVPVGADKHPPSCGGLLASLNGELAPV